MHSFSRARDEPDGGDRLIEAFEVSWGDGVPSLGDFWDRHGAGRPTSLLVVLVKIDLRNRFDRGESPSVAPYLERFPELAETSDQVVSLVYEEFCLREERGECVDSREFCAAYEPWKDSLLSQLAYHRDLSRGGSRGGPSTRFPAPGDRFARFMLGPLLGKGGMAQVYLATPDDLEEQKVAIKISPRFGREASILAMLDHRNIVSLLSITETDENGLRGICMPYRPGITLDRLIRKFGAEGPPKTARELWDLLGAPPLEGVQTEGDTSGWADFPIEGTFLDAIAWIGLCLANALTHAHKQKILHRDVKPANILLAFREGPQLLDFNLADDPKAPEEAKAAHKGGTLPYMAPEQLHAFLDPTAWGDVASPADVYSLGLVLREFATGQAPVPPNAFLPLPRAIQDLLDRRAKPLAPARRLRPDMPPALESILARCLAFDRRRRYAGARELAEDLRRFLDRRPLRHAPNTSVIERASNLARRNRRGLRVALGALLILPLAIWATRARPFQETWAFARAIADLDAGRLELARVAFKGFFDSHPDSAWSRLYYGLTLLKIGNDTVQANHMFTTVPTSTHAVEAILHRLNVEPHSALLLTELGLAYIHLGRWDDARRVLEQACRSEPLFAQSFAVSVDVEAHFEKSARSYQDRMAHLARSVELLTKALELVVKPGESPSTMELAWRNSLIRNASRLASAICREPTMRLDRERLRSLYDRVENNIVMVEPPTWSDKEIAKMGGSKEYCLNYYRGLVAQGRALLAMEEDNPKEMCEFIEMASSKFRKALDAKPGDQEALRRIKELGKLERSGLAPCQ